MYMYKNIFCATDMLVIRSSKTLANHYCFMPQHVCCKAYGSLPVCQCVSICVCVCVCVYVSVFVFVTILMSSSRQKQGIYGQKIENWHGQPLTTMSPVWG